MWSGLGQAATVAQLVGADVGSLISVIMQAAMTARQNKKECEQLARRVFMIAELLPHLQDPEVIRRPEVRRPLAGLDDTLREAHELVTSCQGRAAAYRLVMAWRQAERFREVQSKIDSYLLVFPFISHIDITRRLDRIYRVLLPIPNDATVPSASAGLPSHEMEGERFTMAELAAATNNLATDRQIGTNPIARVYKGWLADGREVAVKQIGNSNLSLTVEEEFQAELSLLSIRHSHIVRLLGWCAAEEKHLLVYEYMKNGTLHDHLHGAPSSSSSPVTTSWRTRIEVLLGVSRAVEHLQSYNGERRPVTIHRDIKPSNILLDDAWAPRLTDFGLSLTWDERECSGPVPVVGTLGYAAPEYVATGCVRPVSDVYSVGVVMLEVLTGRKALSQRAVVKDGCTRFTCESLVDLALPMIMSGKARKLLDKRLTPTPTRRQLRAADMVARTAARCLLHDWVKRPAISEVVVDLKAALELVRFDV